MLKYIDHLPVEVRSCTKGQILQSEKVEIALKAELVDFLVTECLC